MVGHRKLAQRICFAHLLAHTAKQFDYWLQQSFLEARVQQQLLRGVVLVIMHLAYKGQRLTKKCFLALVAQTVDAISFVEFCALFIRLMNIMTISGRLNWSHSIITKVIQLGVENKCWKAKQTTSTAPRAKSEGALYTLITYVHPTHRPSKATETSLPILVH